MLCPTIAAGVTPQSSQRAGERVLDDEQRRLGQRGRGRARPPRRRPARAAASRRSSPRCGRSAARALVDHVPEHRLVAVQPGAHPGVLRALPGEQRTRPAGRCPRPAVPVSAPRRAARRPRVGRRRPRRGAGGCAGRAALQRVRRRRRGPASGARSRCVARAAATAGPARVGRRAPTGRAACGPGRAGVAAAVAGASSSTTWALVPPMPNELTPARRGLPSPSHGPAWSFERRTGCRPSRCAGFGRLEVERRRDHARAPAPAPP